MDKKQHWEQVYTSKAADHVSWFQTHAALSMAFIQDTGLDKQAAILDVGSGASSLVGDLVAAGYTNLSVLDLSSAALDVARQRLGKDAGNVHWMTGDILQLTLPAHHFDIWHDRAVFHFLTDPAERRAYVAQAMRALRRDGHMIIATFAEDGPEKCSGLPVMRYNQHSLLAEFSDNFLLINHHQEAHHTPAGAVQQFIYCHFRKRNGIS